MNELDLVEALRGETAQLTPSPQAADGVQRWITRGRRQRKGTQAVGVAAILAGLVTITLLVVPGSHHRSEPPTLDGGPTPSTQVSPFGPGVLAVLRSDGLHVLSPPQREQLLPDTKGAFGLATSVSGGYVSWMHDSGDGNLHAYVHNELLGTTHDLGPATSAAWSPQNDYLAISPESSVKVLIPNGPSSGLADFGPGMRVQSLPAAFATKVVWRDDGLVLAVGVRTGLLTIKLSLDGDLVGSAHDIDLGDVGIPAGFAPGTDDLYYWIDSGGSTSIALDGLELYRVSINTGAPGPALTTMLPYSDWLDFAHGGVLAITGSSRVAAHAKRLEALASNRPDVPTAPAGTSVTSFAFSPDGQTLARVLLPDPGPTGYNSASPSQLLLSTGVDATSTTVALTDAVAVTQGRDGFVVVGHERLYAVSTSGKVTSLGPVDTTTANYYGRLTPSNVVLLAPTPRAPSPTVTITPRTTSTCRSEQLALTVGPGLLQMTQERGLELLLTNKDKSPCSLNGYPVLTIGDPESIAYTYVRQGPFVTSRAPEPITLSQGESAHVIVAQRACTSSTRAASRLTLQLDTADSRPITLTGSPGGLTHCTDTSENTIEVSSYAATFAAASP